MGEAMISSLLERGLTSSGDVTVSDISEERCQYIKDKYGISVTGDNLRAIKDAEVIVLAVKPQHLAEPIADISGELQPSQLVLSIIAGAKIETLVDGLAHRSIVRVMPNTPAQIGEGMSVWTATSNGSRRHKPRIPTATSAFMNRKTTTAISRRLTSSMRVRILSAGW